MESVKDYQQFREDNFRLKNGCYVKEPKKLGYQGKSSLLAPLKHIDYQIDIINSLVHITLIQKYANPIESYLELQYSFPINPKSCIYRFIAQFGQQRIQGIVKQKEQAKEEYKAAIKEGRQATYGQIDQKSHDIMNMEIGNVPPKSQVTITISIIQQLDLSMNTFYKLFVPSTISPRYINDIPKIKEQKPLSAESVFTWNFKINLKTSKKAVFYQSSTHKLQIINQNELKTQTLLIMNKQCIPSKDFQFMYTVEEYHLPTYVLGRTDKSATAMLSFIPKFCQLSVDDAYKAEIAKKGYETQSKSVRGEFLFLLDRSGSMSGSSITNAKKALQIFIKSLPQDSYFNVVSFGSSHQFLFHSNSKYNNENVKYAIDNIQNMQADLGGTQIQEPLGKILNSPIIPGYPKQIFLLTDGEVSNTQQVINLVQKYIKYARVHTIGIGNGASQALIKGCAQKGRGKSVTIIGQQNITEKVIQILQQSFSPVITQISLQYDKNIVQTILPNPYSMPYILKNDLINFYVVFNNQINKQTKFILEYTDSHNKLKYKSEILINPDSQNDPIVDKMAHYKIIKKLQDTQKQGKIQEELYTTKIKNIKNQIIQQSISNQILSKYTAFVCVGKKLNDQQFQTYKDVKVEKLQIRQPIPISNYNNNYQQTIGTGSTQDRFRTLCRSSSPQIAQNRMLALDKLQQQSDMLSDIYLKKASRTLKKSSGFRIGSAIGGFFTGIKDGIKNMFSSKDQQSPNVYQQKSMKKEVYNDEADKNVYLEEKKQKSQLKQVQKSISKKSQSTNLIERIISEQSTDGSWTNQKLFSQMFPQASEKIKVALNEFKKEIILTYLIVKWIEKYHQKKQYKLIVKKAMQWVEKYVTSQGYNMQKLTEQIDNILIE